MHLNKTRRKAGYGREFDLHWARAGAAGAARRRHPITTFTNFTFLDDGV